MIYNETDTNNNNNNLIFARVAKFGSEYIKKKSFGNFFCIFLCKVQNY